jgi:hypothetical protein
VPLGFPSTESRAERYPASALNPWPCFHPGQVGVLANYSWVVTVVAWGPLVDIGTTVEGLLSSSTQHPGLCPPNLLLTSCPTLLTGVILGTVSLTLPMHKLPGGLRPSTCQSGEEIP